MATIAQLVVAITSDTKGLISGVGKSQAALGTLNKATGQTEVAVTSAFKTAIPLATAAAAVAVTKFVGDSINAARDLVESQNKVNVVFEQSAASIQDWSGTTASSFGISQQAALEAAGTFGNLFDAMGLADQAGAEMSTTLVELAADLASFNNASPEDVLQALQSGLTGQIRPLRQFGIEISQAAIQQEALAEGIDKSVTQMTLAEKVQLRYALILKQSGNAQGDFARTSDELANQQRIAAAQWEDLQATLGMLLLPAVLATTSALNDFLRVILFLTGAVDGFDDATKRASIDLFDFELRAAGWAERFLSNIPILGDAIDAWDRYNAAQDAASKRTSLTADQLQQLNLLIRTGAPEFANFRDKVMGMVDGFLGLSGKTRDAKGAVEGLVGIVQRFIGVGNNAADAANNEADAHRNAAEAIRKHRAAELALIDPLFAVLDSADSLKDAQSEVNRLRRKGKTDTDAYRDAVRGEIEAYSQVQGDLIAYATALTEAGKNHRQVTKDVEQLGKELGLTKKDVRGVISALNDIPGKVATTITANDDQARSTIVSLEDRLNQLAAHDWEVRIRAITSGGSTAFDLLDHLEKALHHVVDQDWEVVINAVAKGAQDQLETFRDDFDDLQQRAEKLADKMGELGDAIRQGFSQFDLIGGAIDLLDEFNQQMQEFLDAQAAGTLEPGAVAPTAPDLGAFVAQQAAQAQQLADVLTQLSEAGLNKKLLADLAAQGPAGIALGQALLDNPALIAQFNAAQQQIAEATGQAVDDIIRDQFGGAVDNLSDRFDKLVGHLSTFIGRLDTDDDSAVKALNKFIRALEDLTGGHGGDGGGAGGGGGNGFGGPKFGPPETPPVQVVVKLDSGELIAWVDEGIGKRERTQGRLAHHH